MVLNNINILCYVIILIKAILREKIICQWSEKVRLGENQSSKWSIKNL